MNWAQVGGTTSPKSSPDNFPELSILERFRPRRLIFDRQTAFVMRMMATGQSRGISSRLAANYIKIYCLTAQPTRIAAGCKAIYHSLY